MSLLELPHTTGCLVCGRDNPYGLHLHLSVNDAGVVVCEFVPTIHHIGFEGIVHGGLTATVLDEAMVWAATWAGKRFCVCGEMTVRFRRSALVGQPLRVEARIKSSRSRLIESESQVTDAAGNLLAQGYGKYVPVDRNRNAGVIATLVDEPQVQSTLQALRESQ